MQDTIKSVIRVAAFQSCKNSHLFSVREYIQDTSSHHLI